MTYSRLQADKKGRAELFHAMLLSLVILFILTVMTGCGAKKKIPEAVELDPGQQRIVDWYALIQEKRHAPEREKLESVNDFFNRLEFVDDLRHWGKVDYCATPREMLTSNGGDCEDFATAKYFTLRQMDIPDARMHLTYVKVLKLEQPHMVLSYYAESNANPLILDSIVDAIQPASERSDLIPIYSFNGEGLWLAKKQSTDHLGGSERLSLWQELQIRFNREAVAAPLP